MEDVKWKTKTVMMKLFKNIIFLCGLCASNVAFAQYRSAAVINPMENDTISWLDERGVNLLVMGQSDIISNESEGTSSQWISMMHWLKEDDRLMETWSYQDSIIDCPLDIELKFLAEPRYPDIDHDGYHEVYFIVQKSCKGDISPAIVQVIMVHHRRVKYFMEADQKLVFPDGTTGGGDYDLGDFEELPKSFQDYAVWYLKEHYTYTYQ